MAWIPTKGICPMCKKDGGVQFEHDQRRAFCGNCAGGKYHDYDDMLMKMALNDKPTNQEGAKLPLFKVVITKKVWTGDPALPAERTQVEKLLLNKNDVLAPDSNTALVIAGRTLDAAVTDEELTGAVVKVVKTVE